MTTNQPEHEREAPHVEEDRPRDYHAAALVARPSLVHAGQNLTGVSANGHNLNGVEPAGREVYSVGERAGGGHAQSQPKESVHCPPTTRNLTKRRTI